MVPGAVHLYGDYKEKNLADPALKFEKVNKNEINCKNYQRKNDKYDKIKLNKLKSTTIR